MIDIKKNRCYSLESKEQGRSEMISLGAVFFTEHTGDRAAGMQVKQGSFSQADAAVRKIMGK